MSAAVPACSCLHFTGNLWMLCNQGLLGRQHKGTVGVAVILNHADSTASNKVLLA